MTTKPEDATVTDATKAASDIHTTPISTTERAMTEVPPPVWDYLSAKELWSGDKPNIAALKAHFLKEGRLDPKDAVKIINAAAAVLKKEPNLLTIQDPVTVCGDIHGQFFDLVKLFEVGGDPFEGVKYLFLGDYVDRGYFATEVCLYLLSMKIHFPDTFYMLRGNHECRHLTAYFNFKQECQYKYNLEVYEAFMSCFDCLPLAAILNTRFLCVHGGLSPEVQTVEEINLINRFREPPTSGPMCDLLWSDPMEQEEEENDPSALFVHNELRGCSFNFSYKAASAFLKANNLLSIIRAHEAQDEGYRLYKKSVTTGFPTVICIFSAPNYCDVYNNKGAIIKFQNNLMNIRQFNCSPHPYFLPNFMNAFDWSLPFVAEKVADMFATIISLCDDDESDSEDEGKTAITEERGDVIRAKIRAMGKMCRMYKTLREETDTIVLLKGLAGGSIPQGILLSGPDAVREAVSNFEKIKKIDVVNEKRPPLGPGQDAVESSNLASMNEKFAKMSTD